MDVVQVVGLALPALVPVVTGVVAAAGVAYQDWRTGRSRVGRRKIVLEDARAQVEFVAQWWAAQGQLVPAADRQDHARWALDLLARAGRAVEATELPAPQVHPQPWLRRLALLYPFTSLAGRVLRVGFFALSGLSLIALASSLSQQLASEPGRASWVNAYLVLGVLYAVLALVVRFTAAAVERGQAAATGQGRGRPGLFRRVLLLVRLRRPGAQVVRALFYLSLVAAALYLIYAVEWMWFEWRLVRLPSYLATLVVLGGVAVGLRRWALSAEAARP